MTRTYIIAAATALLLAAPVHAAPASISVAYGDLDLSTNTGRDVLAQRVQQAAAKLCGPVDYSLDGHGSAVYEAEQAHRDCLHNTALSVAAKIDVARAEASARRGQKLAGN
jgi:UrcA family protein